MEVGRKNYAAANTAIRALANATQDLPALARAHYLVRAAAFAAQANDPQGAKQYLSKAMKAANDLYQTDAFGDPANEAPKSSVAVNRGVEGNVHRCRASRSRIRDAGSSVAARSRD